MSIRILVLVSGHEDDDDDDEVEDDGAMGDPDLHDESGDYFDEYEETGLKLCGSLIWVEILLVEVIFSLIFTYQNFNYYPEMSKFNIYHCYKLALS